MFNRGRYFDSGDPREMGPKRQRIMDQGSSYYSVPPGSSYVYNPPTLPPHDSPYVGQHPPSLPVVRLRGLPFDCSEVEIADFMQGLDVVDVLLVHKKGKFTGEAYCVLGYPLQVDYALQRNRHNIGKRYVEVFRSGKMEYYRAISNEVSDSRGGSGGGGGGGSVRPRAKLSPREKSSEEGKELEEHTGVLRLRGLPFSATKEDIKDFFKDFSLSENSIHLTANSEGRATGEAFVEFLNAHDSEAAMAKDRMKIGSRYIELFPSSLEELEDAVSRGGLLDNKQSEGQDAAATENTSVLRMRGLPYSVIKEDIKKFFEDFVLSDESIHFRVNAEGRPTGEGFVEFCGPQDAKVALAKDRMTLGSRYIELFPSSPEELNEALSRV